MDAAQETTLDTEPLGLAIDELDNLAHALILPMPAAFHVDQLKASLPDVVRKLKDGFVKATGQDPWVQ